MKARASKGSEKRFRTVKAMVQYGREKHSQDNEPGADGAQPEATKL